MKFVLEKEENILRKGENASYQHFFLYPKCFQKPPSSRLLKVGIVLQRVNHFPKKLLFLHVAGVS